MKDKIAYAVLQKNNETIEGSNAYALVIYGRKSDAVRFHKVAKIIKVKITEVK